MIEIRLSFTEQLEKEKALEVLSKSFNVIKFNKDYKNRNNVSSRVYVDVDGDCDGPVYIIEITTADDETNGCYEMTFSQKKAHFQFHKNLTIEKLIDTFDTG